MDSGSGKMDLAYVAELARIRLDAGTMAKLQPELDSILEYVKQLSALDVDGIEPTAHAAPMSNVLREDCAAEPFQREAMLRNAPATVDGELIQVPKVIPGEEMS